MIVSQKVKRGAARVRLSCSLCGKGVVVQAGAKDLRRSNDAILCFSCDQRIAGDRMKLAEELRESPYWRKAHE